MMRNTQEVLGLNIRNINQKKRLKYFLQKSIQRTANTFSLGKFPYIKDFEKWIVFMAVVLYFANFNPVNSILIHMNVNRRRKAKKELIKLPQ